MDLQQHPLSAAFPGMTDLEFQGLLADIGQRGQRDEITIYDGQVLDGWHRYQACNELGIPARKKSLPDGVDPVAFVKSYNLHRRHMDSNQRAAAVVACTEWAKVGNPNFKPNMDHGSTLKEMAEEADVSTKTIQRAKTAHAAGLGDKVRDGELTAKKAAEIANPPKPKPEPSAVIKLEEPQEETVTIPKEQYDEIVAMIDENLAEGKALADLIDGNFMMHDAIDKIRQQTALVTTYKGQLEAANNKNNEMIKIIKAKDRQIAKLEKRVLEFELAELPL